MPKVPKSKQVLDIARKAGMFRAHEMAKQGIPRVYLQRLEQQGLLVREARGLYVHPDTKITENHSLAEAAKRVSHGVLCLLSALRFHGLTTQNPSEVWLAIGLKARAPKKDTQPLRIVRMSGKALAEGIEEHLIEGVSIRVYNPAKTVADCFKYRHKIGIDVALEALRKYRKAYRAGMDELWHFTKVCRVAKVMQPYLEALA